MVNDNVAITDGVEKHALSARSVDVVVAAKHKRASISDDQIIAVLVVEGTLAASAAADLDLVLGTSCRAACCAAERRDAVREEEEVITGRGGLVREAAFGGLAVAASEMGPGERRRLGLDIGP